MARIRAELVEWDDAETKVGWVHAAEAEVAISAGPCRCASLGFVVSEDKENLWIAGSVAPGGWGELTRIPKGMVHRRTVIWRPSPK